MAKEKTRMVTLEVRTALNNKDLVLELAAILNSFGADRFVLAQKPRVQVAQQPAAKVSK